MYRGIVAHCIAGYPTRDKSIEIARALIEGGAACLEIQIPFSDPNADGPVIEEACRCSLEGGMSVDASFEMVNELHAEFPATPIFIMSYGNIVFSRGVEMFVLRAKAVGASGLIIPDLTPGQDEGLYGFGEWHGMTIVPVVVPSISQVRLEAIAQQKPEWVYVALRSGITGSYTTISSESLEVLSRIRKLLPETSIMAGFGIRDTRQIELLTPHCDAVVAGSVFVKTVQEALAAGEEPAGKVMKIIRELAAVNSLSWSND